DEGTVAKIVVPAGTEGVKVNAVIAVLAGEGEDASAAAKSAAAKAQAPKAEAKAPAPAQPAAPAAKPVSTNGAAAAGDGSRILAAPLARRIARDAGAELRGVNGSGPHGRIVKSDVEAAIAGGAKAAPAAKAPAAPAAQPAPAAKPISDEAVLKLFEAG